MGIPVAGSNVLVTGATSGIGAALAVMLAEHGATVGLVGRREQKLATVLEQCQSHVPACRMWVADLGELDRAEALAIEAWDTFGGLDVLVNNAAIPKRRPLTQVTADELGEVMRVNFESPVRMTMAVLPRMLDRDRGVIVNVSSLGGRLGIQQESAYCASKFALAGWSEAAALDLWGTGVDVRLILPGAIDTDIWTRPDNEPALYDGPLEPPETVAAGIVAAIEGDRFEHYLPDMKWVAEFKTSDIDAFLEGSAKMLKED
jgi:short-subunit dehydrogenase